MFSSNSKSKKGGFLGILSRLGSVVTLSGNVPSTSLPHQPSQSEITALNESIQEVSSALDRIRDFNLLPLFDFPTYRGQVRTLGSTIPSLSYTAGLQQVTAFKIKFYTALQNYLNDRAETYNLHFVTTEQESTSTALVEQFATAIHYKNAQYVMELSDLKMRLEVIGEQISLTAQAKSFLPTLVTEINGLCGQFGTKENKLRGFDTAIDNLKQRAQPFIDALHQQNTEENILQSIDRMFQDIKAFVTKLDFMQQFQLESKIGKMGEQIENARNYSAVPVYFNRYLQDISTSKQALVADLDGILASYSVEEQEQWLSPLSMLYQQYQDLKAEYNAKAARAEQYAAGLHVRALLPLYKATYPLQLQTHPIMQAMQTVLAKTEQEIAAGNSMESVSNKYLNFSTNLPFAIQKLQQVNAELDAIDLRYHQLVFDSPVLDALSVDEATASHIQTVKDEYYSFIQTAFNEFNLLLRFRESIGLENDPAWLDSLSNFPAASQIHDVQAIAGLIQENRKVLIEETLTGFKEYANNLYEQKHIELAALRDEDYYGTPNAAYTNCWELENRLNGLVDGIYANCTETSLFQYHQELTQIADALTTAISTYRGAIEAERHRLNEDIAANASELEAIKTAAGTLDLAPGNDFAALDNDQSLDQLRHADTSQKEDLASRLVALKAPFLQYIAHNFNEAMQGCIVESPVVSDQIARLFAKALPWNAQVSNTESAVTLNEIVSVFNPLYGRLVNPHFKVANDILILLSQQFIDIYNDEAAAINYLAASEYTVFEADVETLKQRDSRLPILLTMYRDFLKVNDDYIDLDLSKTGEQPYDEQLRAKIGEHLHGNNIDALSSDHIKWWKQLIRSILKCFTQPNKLDRNRLFYQLGCETEKTLIDSGYGFEERLRPQPAPVA